MIQFLDGIRNARSTFCFHVVVTWFIEPASASGNRLNPTGVRCQSGKGNEFRAGVSLTRLISVPLSLTRQTCRPRWQQVRNLVSAITIAGRWIGDEAVGERLRLAAGDWSARDDAAGGQIAVAVVPDGEGFGGLVAGAFELRRADM